MSAASDDVTPLLGSVEAGTPASSAGRYRDVLFNCVMRGI